MRPQFRYRYFSEIGWNMLHDALSNFDRQEIDNLIVNGLWSGQRPSFAEIALHQLRDFVGQLFANLPRLFDFELRPIGHSGGAVCAR